MRRSSATSKGRPTGYWVKARRGRLTHWADRAEQRTMCGRPLPTMTEVQSVTGAYLDEERPGFLGGPACKHCLRKWREQWLKQGNWTQYGAKRH